MRPTAHYLVPLVLFHAALLTLAEYLIDYGDDELREMGWAQIDREALKIKSERRRQAFRQKLELVKKGARDLYF